MHFKPIWSYGEISSLAMNINVIVYMNKERRPKRWLEHCLALQIGTTTEICLADKMATTFVLLWFCDVIAASYSWTSNVWCALWRCEVTAASQSRLGGIPSLLWSIPTLLRWSLKRFHLTDSSGACLLIGLQLPKSYTLEKMFLVCIEKIEFFLLLGSKV